MSPTCRIAKLVQEEDMKETKKLETKWRRVEGERVRRRGEVVGKGKEDG